MTIDSLIANVSLMYEQLTNGTILSEIIRENEPYIIDMNTQSQLWERGINTAGVEIMDYKPYSPLTIQIKMETGQPYNRVTLHDTGDFYSSFYIETHDDSFDIKASDWKTAGLIRKYDRRILGLTAENKNELAWEYVYPDALDKIKNIIYEDTR